MQTLDFFLWINMPIWHLMVSLVKLRGYQIPGSHNFNTSKVLLNSLLLTANSLKLLTSNRFKFYALLRAKLDVATMRMGPF